MPDLTRTRKVVAIVDALETFEGEGFLVHRPFPTPSLAMVDPFLLLDEMGPVELRPGEAKGAPDHPHRGFETVTYVLEGEFEHEDSAGNRGSIGTGDVQWMTAGAGVVHSEMPARSLQETGGRVHGVQLWVNLPAAQKMVSPRYQDLRAAELPVARGDGFTLTVIAGDVLGVSGPGDTYVPIVYAHARVDAHRELEIPLPSDTNAVVYVLGGSAELGPDAVQAGRAQLAVFDPGEAPLGARAGDRGLDAIILAGRPLREPVVRYGPFVMNTKEQIVEAFDDFREGRMGAIAREGETVGDHPEA